MERETEAGRLFKLLIESQQHSTTQIVSAFQMVSAMYCRLRLRWIQIFSYFGQ